MNTAMGFIIKVWWLIFNFSGVENHGHFMSSNRHDRYYNNLLWILLTPNTENNLDTGEQMLHTLKNPYASERKKWN